MNATHTIADIQTTFASTLRNVLGVIVEATHRGDGEWTISGASADVACAVRFLLERGLLVETGRTFDAELGELFVYLQAKG